MPAIIMDGKALAKERRIILKRKAAELTAAGCRPHLAVLLVGDDPASHVYVKNKQADAEKMGFGFDLIHLPGDIAQADLLARVKTLNDDPAVHGVIMQLPLPRPKGLVEACYAINPSKDVDAFHPHNIGKMCIGEPDFAPGTPGGIMTLLEEYKIPVAGKHCVVVGRSDIVGKPMAMLLLHAHATVTICHSRTPDLAFHTKQADILVAAVGKIGLISKDMIKPGAVVIDVAMNTKPDGKLIGDVDPGAAEVAGYITPVPGGVGPMTRITMFENTLKAAERACGK
jgi:methylenetetrahydrofolate dehydrogenase (NADP+)/methenyltetrahydrofolate cyclohydrolase